MCASSYPFGIFQDWGIFPEERIRTATLRDGPFGTRHRFLGLLGLYTYRRPSVRSDRLAIGYLEGWMMHP